MKTALLTTTMLLALLAASRAEAAALYTTTDLGAGYQFQSGAGGQVDSVTGADGVTYAFDKSPVTPIDVQSYLPDGSIQYLTLQNGTHQVGYINYYAPGGAGVILYPTFNSSNSLWFVYPSTDSGLPPVSDINSQGQVVGTSLYATGQAGTYAAFTDPSGQAHGFFDNVVDNLNNYSRRSRA